MQGKTSGRPRKRASTPAYVSPNQLVLPGFETPFDQKLTQDNRWVRMAHAIPWDRLVTYYDGLFPAKEGRPPISGRVILGAVIIKHLGDLSDRETIAQIQENMFMQYFLGYSSFTNEAPFSDTLFVEIRKRLSLELLGKINEAIAVYCMEVLEQKKNDQEQPGDKDTEPDMIKDNVADNPVKEQDAKETTDEEATCREQTLPDEEQSTEEKNAGRLIVDATVAPQNITYPTDLKLLDAARRKSEEIIDKIYDPSLHGKPKVRTYREIARKNFLNAAKKKRKTARQIYKVNGQQLRFLKRNLAHIENLLKSYDTFPLSHKEQKYLMVLHTVYEQQEQMHRTRSKRIDYRIVNIHQPHVRPIVRGKDSAKTEFGSKIQMSLTGGFVFIDHLSWEAYNEGGYLLDSIEKYKVRFGHYPAEVLADQIYCNRQNRKELKLLGIKLKSKPLGRPSAQAVHNHISPGERNPIEGKFGQAKTAYGLNKIRAKLSDTSTSWVAAIALVLNLVKLAGMAPLCLMEWINRGLRWQLATENISNSYNIKKFADF